MEGNLPSGSMMRGIGSYGGGIDFQGMSLRLHQHHQQPHSVQLHHHSHPRQGSIVHPQVNENAPLSIGRMHDVDQTVSIPEYVRGERGKNSTSEEEEPSFTDDAADGQKDGGRGKKISPWHRVKWTDEMVRLLITAVSYIGEDAAAEYGSGGRRKCVNLQKKGKWKSVSKVMAERGHFVSPQQCEDKFNDLNKRYKRLNEILGRGTSCEVVEDNSLLEVMDISEKAKEEVRKILSSKHLHYEEMCSYHNGNRLHLPPDPELQHSLRLALRSRDNYETNDSRKHPHDDIDEDDHDAEMEDFDELMESQASHGDRRGVYGMPGAAAKKVKQCQGHDTVAIGNSLDCNRTFNPQPQSSAHVDINQVLPEGMKENLLQTQWMKHRSKQLEEQKLQLEAQMLELEKERYKWQRFCRKRDEELEIMRTENERMKLENDHMALELKCKEMGAETN